jgi:hypothetical protein
VRPYRELDTRELENIPAMPAIALVSPSRRGAQRKRTAVDFWRFEVRALKLNTGHAEEFKTVPQFANCVFEFSLIPQLPPLETASSLEHLKDWSHG